MVPAWADHDGRLRAIDPLAVGTERTGGTEFIDANIARILIYSRPLSDVEMEHNISELDYLYMVPRGSMFMFR